jgi:urea carboxylase-associated protein 1
MHSSPWPPPRKPPEDRPSPDAFPTPPRHDEVVAARGYTAFEVSAGETVRVVDLEGQQAVDLNCYRLDDLTEHFWAAHTAKIAGRIYVSTGDVLWSDRMNPMMTITEDTCGVNDVICGSCSYALDVYRYGEELAQRGCMDNFADSIAPWGLGRGDIPMCFNIFLRYPVEESGAVTIQHDAPSLPGDFIDMRAEMDLLISISNCPQENNPCTGFNPTPIRVAVF